MPKFGDNFNVKRERQLTNLKVLNLDALKSYASFYLNTIHTFISTVPVSTTPIPFTPDAGQISIDSRHFSLVPEILGNQPAEVTYNGAGTKTFLVNISGTLFNPANSPPTDLQFNINLSRNGVGAPGLLERVFIDDDSEVQESSTGIVTLNPGDRVGIYVTADSPITLPIGFEIRTTAVTLYEL